MSGKWLIEFLKLFATKYLEWSYQKEWRLLGEQNTCGPAPKITKITIGRNASNENVSKLKELCLKQNIRLEFQK